MGKERHCSNRGLEERGWRGMWHVGGTGEFIQSFGGGAGRKNHLEDLDVEETIILKLIFKRWDGEVCTGFIWLKIGTGARLL